MICESYEKMAYITAADPVLPYAVRIVCCGTEASVSLADSSQADASYEGMLVQACSKEPIYRFGPVFRSD